MTASHENLTSGFPYSSVNHTSGISMKVCCHVSGPVPCPWDTVERKTNTTVSLMVPAVKNKKLVNHDCAVVIVLPPSAVANISQLPDYSTVRLEGR